MDSLRPDQWVNFVTSILTGLIILAGIYAGYKRWIRSVAASTDETERQLKTKNGHTIGEIIEDSHEKLNALIKSQQSRLDNQDEKIDDNTRKIERLYGTVESTNQFLNVLMHRFDEFLKEYHRDSRRN